MNELRIVRGTDVKLYADGTPLFGVTAIRAVEKRRYHEVYEYLSPTPYERAPQGSVYEIELSFMAMFGEQLPDSPGFSLSAADGDSEYVFVNCRITGQKTELNGNSRAVEVITLEADGMRKQVTAVG